MRYGYVLLARHRATQGVSRVFTCHFNDCGYPRPRGWPGAV